MLAAPFTGRATQPSKKKSPERIDGIVALVMGLDRATTHMPFEWYVVGNLAL